MHTFCFAQNYVVQSIVGRIDLYQRYNFKINVNFVVLNKYFFYGVCYINENI